MRYRVNNQIVFQKPPEGPLVPWLQGFAASLSAQRFSRSTTHHQLRQIVHFSEWLGERRIKSSNLSSTEVARYLRTRPLPSQRRDARPPLKRLMEYLRLHSVVAPRKPAPPLSSAERCVQDYEQYLREQRGLAESTIVNYALRARSFLRHRFGNEEVTLSQLNPADVIAFVRDETARYSNRGTKATVPGALRAFLRYVHIHAEDMPDLVAHVPRVASWPMTSVPRGIAADQARKLLNSVDRGTPV